MADTAVIVVSVIAVVFFIALCVALYLFFSAKGRFKSIMSKKLKLMKEIKHDLNEVKIQNNELTQQLETIEQKTGIHIAEITGYTASKKTEETTPCVFHDDAGDHKNYTRQSSAEKKETDDLKSSSCDIKKQKNVAVETDREGNRSNYTKVTSCEELALAERKKEKGRKLADEIRKLDTTVNQLQSIVETLLNENEKQNYCLQSFEAEQQKMHEHMQNFADELTKSQHTRQITRIQSQQAELANHLQSLQQQNSTKESALIALKNELRNIRRANAIDNMTIEDEDTGAIVPTRTARGGGTCGREYTHKCFRDSLPISPIEKYPVIKTYTVTRPFYSENEGAVRSTEEIQNCLNKIRALTSNNSNYNRASSYYVSPPLSASSTIVGLSQDTPLHSPKTTSDPNPYINVRGIGKDVHVWKTSWRAKYI